MELVRCESLLEAEKAEKFEANKKKKLNLMFHGVRGALQSVSFSSNSYDDAKTIKHNEQPLLVDFNNHEKHRFYVVGSCDGLLLVLTTTGLDFGVGVGHVLYIWNPTTGHYKTLPQLSPHMDECVVFGFGPDLTTTDSDNKNHYKVLYLETILAGDSGPKLFEFKVNIYTTHTNSWKTLLSNFSPYGYNLPHPKGMVLAYDNLHLVAEIDTSEYEPEIDTDDDDQQIKEKYDDDPPIVNSIISFDLKDDKFNVLIPPVPAGAVKNICSLNSDLCAFSVTFKDGGCFYHIWRMENFSGMNEKRWTEIYSIDCCFPLDNSISFISSLHVLDDGQILLYAEPQVPNLGKPFIVSYNTKNKMASHIVQVNNPFVYIPVVYEKSFISPNAASTAEEELSEHSKRRRTYMKRCTRDVLSPTTF